MTNLNLMLEPGTYEITIKEIPHSRTLDEIIIYPSSRRAEMAQRNFDRTKVRCVSHEYCMRGHRVKRITIMDRPGGIAELDKWRRAVNELMYCLIPGGIVID